MFGNGEGEFQILHLLIARCAFGDNVQLGRCGQGIIAILNEIAAGQRFYQPSRKGWVRQPVGQ